MKPGKNNYVDHIDCNGLNNQRSNLRLATPQLNAANNRSKNRHGFRGITKHHGGKFRAQITIMKKVSHLGLFTKPEDAARAYDVAAFKEFGEFATLNFPQSIPD